MECWQHSRHVRSVANNTISTQKQCKDFNLHWMCLYIVNIRLSDRQKKFWFHFVIHVVICQIVINTFLVLISSFKDRFILSPGFLECYCIINRSNRRKQGIDVLPTFPVPNVLYLMWNPRHLRGTQGHWFAQYFLVGISLILIDKKNERNIFHHFHASMQCSVPCIYGKCLCRKPKRMRHFNQS